MRLLSGAILGATSLFCGTLLLINNDPKPGWLLLTVGFGLILVIGLSKDRE